tara:strand:+ start:716 stop:1555 length:840 start_codon:yes stop_codon:yes gene_type:complete
MSDMKLILENWSNYSKAQKLAENPQYIHEFLGVSPVLLESDSNEYYRQILEQQELYEGMLDSIKKFIGKQVSGQLTPIKNLARVIGQSIKDTTGEAAKKFITLIQTQVINPIFKEITNVLKKLKLDTISKFISDKIFTPINNIQGLFKKVFATTTAAVLLYQAYQYAKPFITGIKGLAGKALDDAKGKLVEKFQEFVKGGAANAVKTAAQASGFDTWLKATAGAIVGGIPLVADALEPATTRYFKVKKVAGPNVQRKGQTAAQKKKAMRKAAKKARRRE